jgi:L,D-transpeptidase catalytic domain
MRKKNNSMVSLAVFLLHIFLSFFLPSSAHAVLKMVTAPIDVKNEVQILHHKEPHLNPEILLLALKAYNKVATKGLVTKPYLTVIDYSLQSKQKRLWVINLKNHSIPYFTYVAHGRNSGLYSAKHFSNKVGSLESSLGVFLTKNTYFGGKGLSLRIAGLEKGVNDRAFIRDIVIHGAWYAGNSFVKSHGYVGRSWGCPALPANLASEVINTIKNGTMIFAYYPDRNWLHHSSYLA